MPDRNKSQSGGRGSQSGNRRQDHERGSSRQQEQSSGNDRSRQQGDMERDDRGRFENR